MQAVSTPTLALAATIQLAALIPMAACVHGNAQTEAVDPLDCGHPLSDEEIILIAEDAIRAIGGNPAALMEQHEVQILREGCDYILSAVPRGTDAVEGISLRITKDGKVKSFPWCCPLGSCPELCRAPAPHPEDPPRPGPPRVGPMKSWPCSSVPEFEVGPSTPPKFISGEIPLPSEALDPLVASFPDGQVQLSFVANIKYPDSRIRDFYAEWARKHGWTKISSDEDPLSVDRWQRFGHIHGRPIDQWLVHWRSPDGSESLRLALRHVGDRAKQEVYALAPLSGCRFRTLPLELED